MGAVATFVLADWRAAYPMFSNVSDGQLEGPVLTLASQYCRNDGCSPIPDQYVDLQTQALYLMMAHICQLMFGTAANPASGIVGRISDATEGSVSIGTEYMPMTPTNAWFNQTTFGAA